MLDSNSAAIVAEPDRPRAGQRRIAAFAALAVALFTAAVAAGRLPGLELAAWLLASFAAIGLAHGPVGEDAVTPTAGVDGAELAAGVESGLRGRRRELAAALSGLASGAAGTLFLPSLDTPARIALTLAACAGLCAAIVEAGQAGRAFRLQNACCTGQFALAWWRLAEPGSALVAAALAGFGLLAALASTSVARLRMRARAASLENRRLLDSLAAEHARALAADRAKTRFVAAASHDLRQPAAALSLMTNLLRQQATDPALAPLVQGLERSAQSLNELLGQLLDLSRLETGRIAVQIRPVNMDALLDELAAELEPQAGERGLTLKVARCGRELDCDRVLVLRMLRNLADNALRHTREGGITLAAEAGATLRLSVSDTGPGIAVEHQQRIFEEHYQVGNDARQRAHGLGLGLAIVRRIAALHGVAIALDSAPGRGSRFTLEFGAADHRPLRHAAPVPVPEREAGRARRLLLVEDDETLAQAFRAWFQAAGFETRCAADGTEALRALREDEAPEVVVSDFRLPGAHDGLAVLELAARLHPGVCRVLVSGDVDAGLAERARACGVPLLAKPVDPRQLRRLVTGGEAPPLG